MDGSLSASNITGLKDHFGTQKIRLPLKYTESDEAFLPYQSFHRGLTSYGEIIKLEDKDKELFSSISFEIRNSLKSIVLIPLSDHENVMPVEFNKLELQLPHALISNKCASIVFKKAKIESGEESYFIVDLIDENFLLITIKINISDFVKSERGKFVVNKFLEWGKISIPYSFELRSPPTFMRALDSLNCIVSLKDGGMLHFQRPDCLLDFNVFNFHESAPLLPISLTSIFKTSSSHDNFIDGVSSNTVVDLVRISENRFITLSMAKKLKIWDINTYTRTGDVINLDKSLPSSEVSAWLSDLPTKYLTLLRDVSSTDVYLACHFLSSSKNSQESNKDEMKIRFWKIGQTIDGVKLMPINSMDFHPSLPEFHLVTHEESKAELTNASLWFIQDYFCSDIFEETRYIYVLWKTNTASVLMVYVFESEKNKLISLKQCYLNDETKVQGLATFPDSKVYAEIILKSGPYDELIVKTSLNILKKYVNYDGGEEEEGIPLSTSIQRVIEKGAKEVDESPRNLWYRLLSLCEEFRKLSGESLCLSVDSNNSVVALNVNGISWISKSHYFQAFFNADEASDEGKLAILFQKVAAQFSSKTYRRLYEALTSWNTFPLTDTDASELYDRFIRGKIVPDQVSIFLLELGSIRNVLDLIHTLLEIKFISEKDDDMLSSQMTDRQNLSKYIRLKTLTQLKSIRKLHELIIMILAIILLLCESNQETLVLLSRAIKTISNYATFDSIANISLITRGNKGRCVESYGINKVENSLFWFGIVDHFPILKSLLEREDIILAFNYLCGTILIEDSSYMTNSIIELINANGGELVREKFLPKLDLKYSIHKILSGVTYLMTNEPHLFYLAFENYESVGIDDLSESSKRQIAKLRTPYYVKKFSDDLLQLTSNKDSAFKKAKYFHALAELSKSKAFSGTKSAQLTLISSSNPLVLGQNIEDEFLSNALNFEKTAIKCLKSADKKDPAAKACISEYNLSIFEASLELANYKSIYESLSELDAYDGEKSYEMEQLFAKYIKHLIQHQTIHLIFPPNENKLFVKNFLAIDKLLLEIANSELSLAASLRCYEYLYLWRLFGISSEISSDQLVDKRKAIESLYIFITRFKQERQELSADSEVMIDAVKKYKLKILELYMIILNCLKTFEELDDRWIVKSEGKGKLSIMTFDQLSIEYYEWLKELEIDLS